MTTTVINRIPVGAILVQNQNLMMMVLYPRLSTMFLTHEVMLNLP